jgi:hypothetical protein
MSRYSVFYKPEHHGIEIQEQTLAAGSAKSETITCLRLKATDIDLFDKMYNIAVKEFYVSEHERKMNTIQEKIKRRDKLQQEVDALTHEIRRDRGGV